MEKYITDEQNGLEYELVGDYYIVAGEDEPPARPIGVWGSMRRDYLKKHRQSLYYQLLLSGKLNDHLAEIEEQAQDMMWNLTEQMKRAEGATEELKRKNQMAWVGAVNITEQMKRAEGATEELKRKNQMAWVGAVNNIQARVRKIIQHELIYV